jgi:hypothetical protein
VDNLQHRHLRLAGLVFAAGSAVHIADHLRRGQGSVTEVLYVVGNMALVLQVVVITLIFTRHRLAPLVGAVAGPTLALGFAAAHWLPEWSSMSDPVWQVESLTWLSYAASTAEILGAVAVGVTGLAIVRTEGLESFANRRPTT